MAAAPRPDTVDIVTYHGQRGVDILPFRREPSIVLSQEEAVQFLLRSASEYEIVFCTNPTCEVCHAFVSTWESVYSSLSPRWQRVMDRKLGTGEVLRPTLSTENP